MTRRHLRARRAVGAALIRLACLPPDVVGWLVVLTTHALWGQRGKLSVRDGVVTTELRDGAWPARRWAALAFGHVVMFAAGRARERAWKHEKVHVEQCEVAQISSALAALIPLSLGEPLAALVVWSVGYVGTVIGAASAAWLRGGHPYLDNALVRAAYALEGVEDDDTRRSRRPSLRG